MLSWYGSERSINVAVAPISRPVPFTSHGTTSAPLSSPSRTSFSRPDSTSTRVGAGMLSYPPAMQARGRSATAVGGALFGKRKIIEPLNPHPPRRHELLSLVGAADPLRATFPAL